MLGRSTVPGRVALTSRSTNGAVSRKIATTGRLMRNTEPQKKRLSSSPPMTGPMAKPAAKVAAKIPIARDRRRGLANSSLSTASPEGRSVDPPRPIIARETISQPGDADRAARAEPAPKTRAPPIRNLRRP